MLTEVVEPTVKLLKGDAVREVDDLADPDVAVQVLSGCPVDVLGSGIGMRDAHYGQLDLRGGRNRVWRRSDPVGAVRKRHTNDRFHRLKSRHEPKLEVGIFWLCVPHLLQVFEVSRPEVTQLYSFQVWAVGKFEHRRWLRLEAIQGPLAKLLVP